MWVDIKGERKKVACGPCIRGHRSSKCDHRDRVLIEVRKPGRPLSSCPHPTGSCSCERVVIKYTIPKTSECACPSAQPHRPSIAGSSSRVSKSRHQKSTSTSAPALEKASKASEQDGIASASLIEEPSSTASFPPSERGTSNGPSPSSSVSSTPQLLPSISQKQNQGNEIRLPDPLTTPIPSGASKPVPGCCKPKLPAPQISQQPQQQPRSCCSTKTEPIPSLPKASCCSGSKPSHAANMRVKDSAQPAAGSQFAPYIPYSQHAPSFQSLNYADLEPRFQQTPPGDFGTAPPLAFNTPIYSHMESGRQHMGLTHPTQGNPLQVGGMSANPEHNCHCGDSCSCFGCAAHPKNATMTDYVRQMAQVMRTGEADTYASPIYDVPTYPHHPGYGAETHPSNTFIHPFAGYTSHNLHAIPSGRMVNFLEGMGSFTASSSSMPTTWQHNQPSLQQHQLLNAGYYLPASQSGELALEIKTEDSAPSPNDAEGEDAPTLSPSTFLWQEMELPGCSDATGTCQCGDGCLCVGCLTHGGHNGVPLETPPLNGHDGFPDFINSNNFTAGDMPPVTHPSMGAPI